MKRFLYIFILLFLGTTFSVAQKRELKIETKDIVKSDINPLSPAKAALQASGGRASIVGFADQFRDPRTPPPAVLTAGSPCHLTVRLRWWYPALTPAGGWPVLCAPNSRCRRTGLLGAPLVERWTTRQGAAGAVVPLEPVLCLDKSNTHVHSGTARYVYR